MTKIIIIRHGQTNKNIDKKLHDYGDIEQLNDVGKKQMSATAKYLKDNFKIDRVYHSSEIRAKESAEIIANTCGCESVETEGLQERNWGIYTGTPWPQVKEILDELTLDERYKFLPENGESWKMMEKRLINALNQILEQNDEKTVVLVTHGGTIRALIPYLLKCPLDESFKYDIYNASITIFDYDNGNFKAVMINDTSHLDKNLVTT